VSLSLSTRSASPVEARAGRRRGKTHIHLFCEIHSPESLSVTDTLLVFEFSLLESTLAPESASAPAVLLRLRVEPASFVRVVVGVETEVEEAPGAEVADAGSAGAFDLAGSASFVCAGSASPAGADSFVLLTARLLCARGSQHPEPDREQGGKRTFP